MATKMGSVINIDNLSKHYGKFQALNELSLHIDKGEIYGLIGPNGSGKTTTISLLLGILQADKGSKIEILDYEIPHEINAIRKHIGYMPQDITLYEDLSIKKNLEFFAKLNGMSKKFIRQRISEILDLVDLDEFADRLIKNCSGGMQRRASLACTLIHNPDILILDEPTVGVDPELRVAFWDYFRRIADQGKTILITTHYLAESVKCDRVGFLQKQIIAQGKPIDLQKTVHQEGNMAELPSMEQVFIYFVKNHRKNGEMLVIGGKKDEH